MSNGQIFWFMWCLFWSIFWLTIGWFILPVINLLLFAACFPAAIPAFLRRKPEPPYALPPQWPGLIK